MKQVHAFFASYFPPFARRGLVLAALALVAFGGSVQAEEMPPEPPPVLHHGRGEKSPKSACLSSHETRLLVERGDVIPVHKAMQIARSRISGEVVKARLCPDGEQLIYLLTLLDKNGQISVMGMEARTGHILSKP